ncbi:hypothetical protein NFI95_05755 [Acetobacteraceae bacterium KSS8]|uniref:Uncharacterized protein n=1 Tax=Endosaccharibacter trunci TaxID=2812733 RepID=A0ABT1W4Z5_9PROT|nr:hypothetical protein [Acetobacteraceae bacterium KSS8]
MGTITVPSGDTVLGLITGVRAGGIRGLTTLMAGSTDVGGFTTPLRLLPSAGTFGLA